MEFFVLIGLATPAAIIAIIVLACSVSQYKDSAIMWEDEYRRLVGLPLLRNDKIKKRSEESLNLSADARDRIQKEIAFNMKMSDVHKRSQEIRKKEQDLFELEKKLKEQEINLDNRIRSYKDENESLKKTIRDLQSKISSLDRDKRNLAMDLSFYKESERKLQNEIRELQSTESSRTIDELRRQLRWSQSSEESLKKQINEKNVLIQRLDDHLTFYKNEAEKATEKYSNTVSNFCSHLPDEESVLSLFVDASNRLETGAERFFNYPTMRDFYERIKDKRFHRSVTEDIQFISSVRISATLRSESGAYHNTSLTQCSCTDYGRTKRPCKHMLFLAYHVGVLSVRRDLLEQSMKEYFEKLRITPVPKK